MKDFHFLNNKYYLFAYILKPIIDHRKSRTSGVHTRTHVYIHYR